MHLSSQWQVDIKFDLWPGIPFVTLFCLVKMSQLPDDQVVYESAVSVTARLLHFHIVDCACGWVFLRLDLIGLYKDRRASPAKFPCIVPAVTTHDEDYWQIGTHGSHFRLKTQRANGD